MAKDAFWLFLQPEACSGPPKRTSRINFQAGRRRGTGSRASGSHPPNPAALGREGPGRNGAGRDRGRPLIGCGTARRRRGANTAQVPPSRSAAYRNDAISFI